MKLRSSFPEIPIDNPFANCKLEREPFAKILIGECKWTSGENAAILKNEIRWKASMLPFAKGKEVVPVIFAKNATNQTDTAIIITPEGIMDLMK